MLLRLRSFGSWRELLLLGSICCNVVLATYVAVQWLRAEQPLVETLAPSRLVERVAERLPKPDAEILWRVYHSKEAELSAAQADYLRILLKPIDLLTAENFDGGNFRNAVMESREKRLRVGDLVVETLIEAITQISPEGRRQLVRRVRTR
jgi:uncharacterized membrane protein